MAVTIAERIHLYPFRTQKLSSLTPKVLGPAPGRIGSCRLPRGRALAMQVLFSFISKEIFLLERNLSALRLKYFVRGNGLFSSIGIVLKVRFISAKGRATCVRCRRIAILLRAVDLELTPPQSRFARQLPLTGGAKMGARSHFCLAVPLEGWRNATGVSALEARTVTEHGVLPV